MSNIHSVTPDISVLLSVFNEEKYIVDTITSVLDQTYENFELIIIDYASTRTLFVMWIVLTAKQCILVTAHR